jgi:7-carboxy-7-deazaguanine synthase
MNCVDLTELFLSIQGEGTRAGLPCVFIRLSGCNLHCNYCDSEYAARGVGKKTPIDEITARVKTYNVKLVQLTGGEPLIQPGAKELILKLCDAGYELLVETNGSIDLKPFDHRVKFIIDIKTPGSGAENTFLESNFEILGPDDEVKFVITSKEDFDWAAALVAKRTLDARHTVLFTPVWGLVEPKNLVRWILDSGVKGRLSLQIHKLIWGSDATGV